MIITEISKAGPSTLKAVGPDEDPFTDEPPPPFEESTPLIHFADAVDAVPSSSGVSNFPSSFNLDADLVAPPEFSPYHADYFENESGDIISHDPHLNTDGMLCTLLEI